MTKTAQAYVEILDRLKRVNEDIDKGLHVEHIYDFYMEKADIAWMQMTREEQALHEQKTKI